MSWSLLCLAGALEVVWALGLKRYTERREPLVLMVIVLAIVGSVGLLGVACRTLPIGTAYAVWVAIGVVGAVLGGAVLYQEPLGVVRLLLLGLLIASVIGLKITA